MRRLPLVISISRDELSAGRPTPPPAASVCLPLLGMDSRWARQPCPPSTGGDVPDSLLSDAEFRRKLRPALSGAQASEHLPHLDLSQLAHAVAIAPIGCAVLNTVCRILRLRGPRKVRRVDAAEMAVATRVRRLVRGRGWRAVGGLADVAASDKTAAAIPHLSVPVALPAERPSHTFVGRRRF